MTKIPLIYTYCDRWCERCPMTSQCAIYAPNEKESFDVTNKDETKELWESVEDNLAQAMDLLKKAIDESGVIFTHEDNMKSAQKVKENIEFAQNHELSLLSANYYRKARPVLDAINMDEFAKKTIQEVKLGIKNEIQQDEKLKEIERGLEVLHYYLYFINAKCSQAVSSLQYAFIEKKTYNSNFTNDCLGFAKIALITTRRSIDAWVLMMQNQIFSEEETLPILASLQKVEGLIIKYFPTVKTFKRPGFED